MTSGSGANPPRSARPGNFITDKTGRSHHHTYFQICAMAAKKTTSKPAPVKVSVKPAAQSSKPAAAAKKPTPAAPKKPAAVVKKPAAVVKKAVVAPAKKPAAVAKKTVAAPAAKPAAKAAPAKQPVAKKPAPAAKPAPAKKAPPLKKAIAEKPVKKATPPAKPEEKPAKVVIAVVEAPVKAVAPVKAPAPAKKAPATKSRSSVVDFPAPPAPIKPPFVPPKAAPAPAGDPVAPGSNGTHTPAFVQKQRQRLLDLRDDLMDAVSGMARDTIRNAPEGSEASGSGQHQGDAGSDAYDRDFALSVLAKEQDALYEIEQALRRIQSSSYGICEMSARKIPQARLEAIPFARLTVECQAQWEKEYGNRRFRPSNEVGFSGGNFAEDEDSETVSLDEDDD
jgi:DnaK suppressor protein